MPSRRIGHKARLRPGERSGARNRVGRAAEPWTAPSERWATVAAEFLAVALVGGALLIDPLAEAAFDAPKRLVATAAITAAFVALCVDTGGLASLAELVPRLPRALSWLCLTLVAAATLSALASPRRAAALDALRSFALFALLVPLGASRVLEGRRGRALVWCFLLTAAANALLSLIQFGGLAQPLIVERTGSRGESQGGLTGNGAYVALAASFAALALLARIPFAERRERWLLVPALMLFVATAFVNQNLTSMLALIAGAVVLARFVRPFRPAVLVAAAAVALALATPLVPRLVQSARDAASGDVDRLLSYRLGPWAAAAEMSRENPLLGLGPGTFGAEFVPHRLAAEITWHRRFLNPFQNPSYGEAHSEYLQAMAEIGLPAAVALAALVLVVIVELDRTAKGAPPEARAEPALLLAVLTAGAVSAVTWFPLQRTVTSVPLLLATGRAFRVVARGADGSR